MNELQKIIEGFKKAEVVWSDLAKRNQFNDDGRYFEGKTRAYNEVVGVLEDFMSKHSVFCIDVVKVSAEEAEGYRALIKDLEEERSN